MNKIKMVEHLYEIYPSMPRYANDSEESQVIKTYDFILRRFQGCFGKPPKYFVKAGATPVLTGDQHQYVGYPYYSFCSTQDIVIAISKSSSNKIRINNYQSAIYAEKTLQSKCSQWKFNEKDQNERFTNVFIKILSVIAEELKLSDLGGLDILIYTGFIEDQFMGWKESLFSALYSAIIATIHTEKQVQQRQIVKIIKEALIIDQELMYRPQLTNYQYGHFTLHSLQKPIEMPFPSELSLIIAHSMTPLPKKWIQGKRFNLRRCEIMIAIQYIKGTAGTSKELKSLKQLQQFLGITTLQLIQEVQENIPKGRLTTEEIQQYTDQSLINILKEIPYANNVIDQNSQFYPRDRALFFLKEELLANNLSPQNLISSINESFRNQVELLGIGSEQIELLIDIGKSSALAHKIIGNGWGGNVLFVCQKVKATKLMDDLVNQFYLHQDNRILLSDDLQQYVHLVGEPATGLAILDPQSQIWF